VRLRAYALDGTSPAQFKIERKCAYGAVSLFSEGEASKPTVRSRFASIIEKAASPWEPLEKRLTDIQSGKGTAKGWPSLVLESAVDVRILR
jgi:hypothetical protein